MCIQEGDDFLYDGFLLFGRNSLQSSFNNFGYILHTQLFKCKYLSRKGYLYVRTAALNIRYMKYTSCWAALLVENVKHS